MGAAVRSDPSLTISSTLWQTLLTELRRRTQGGHESGAFLLGHASKTERRVEQIVYYDDLDPNAYRTGVVVMHAASFGQLWELCRSNCLSVVADIHVHPEDAQQSLVDRNNPMIALPGHLALIVPHFARPPVLTETLGFYEYLGKHRWRDFSGRRVSCCLHLVDQEKCNG
jgi:proteasome lid subunit RPN8/RPN11